MPARAASTAAEAVRDRDVVILATTSPTPVLDAADLAPGTHVNAVGFKQRGRAEFGPDLPAAAGPGRDRLAGPGRRVRPADASSPADARMRHLGAIVAGDLPGRLGRDEITLFCSVGLAGTEVFLLDRLAATAAAAVGD